MAHKRRLTDLFVVGKELEFDDGSGDPLKVFIRKLNPVDHETALRKANSARARVAAARTDPKSDEYQDTMDGLNDFTREDMEKYLIDDEEIRRRPAIQAELEADEEWSEDGYLQGLIDAQNDGIADPGEEERVDNELRRFFKSVDEAVKAHLDDFRADLERHPDAVIKQMVFDKMFDVRLSVAWLTEYRRCEIWLAIREPDKKTLHLQTRDEVDELPIEVIMKVQETYSSLAVEPDEGKGSRVTDTSSDSSASPVSPETDLPSGLPE